MLFFASVDSVGVKFSIEQQKSWFMLIYADSIGISPY